MSPNLYTSCRLCPRFCLVDRTQGETGFCKSGTDARVAAALLHRGEEPPLTRGEGSGTIFFSGCTLRCDSCQNCDLSLRGLGRAISVETVAKIMDELARRGASNINFVTGTHFAPAIIEAIDLARRKGLNVPTVWNSSGYETIETLELLEPVVDIWLPDIKSLDPGVCKSYFNAANYPRIATEAIEWMTTRGAPKVDSEGKMLSGTIIRHLVMPGVIDDTENVIRWLAERIGGSAIISIMTQYLPLGTLEESPKRTLTRVESDAVSAILEKYEIESGYIQEFASDSPWSPDFSRLNPFPTNYADPVWHWRDGFVDGANPL